MKLIFDIEGTAKTPMGYCRINKNKRGWDFVILHSGLYPLIRCNGKGRNKAEMEAQKIFDKIIKQCSKNKRFNFINIFRKKITKENK